MTDFRIEQGGRVLRSHGRYGAGEARSPRQADTRLQHNMHVFPCIGVVHAGRLEFRTPNGAAIATAGTVLLGNTAEEFSYRYLDTGGAKRSVIAFSEDLLREVADEAGATPRFKVATLPPSRASVRIYGRARKLAAAQLPQDDDVLALLSDILSAGQDAPPKPVNVRLRQRLRSVARHIDAEYANELTLATLAGMAQLSKFHFLRAFTTEIGESPGRYLVAARLRAAANRLIETQDPIAMIALTVGFNDLSHFNATFRETFGTSPRAWRKALCG